MRIPPEIPLAHQPVNPPLLREFHRQLLRKLRLLRSPANSAFLLLVHHLTPMTKTINLTRTSAATVSQNVRRMLGPWSLRGG